MSCIPREALFSPFPIFFARGAAEVLYRAEILHISLLEHRELLRIAVKIEESLFIVRVRIQIEVYVYQNEPALRDRIYRAAGTMKSAYLIDTSEAVQCISDVLIGLQMGFLSGMDAQKLYALEEHIRPAMLTGAPQDRDKKRAEILRANTSGIHPQN